MSIRLTLEEAISNLKTGWTQAAFARDSLGFKVVHRSTRYKPVCYCAVGAVDFSGNTDHNVREEVLDRVCEAIFGERPEKGLAFHMIVGWNDMPYRKAEEVVAVFEQALEKYNVENV